MALSINRVTMMATHRMEREIAQYLAAPSQHPRPEEDEDRHFMFLLNYLGELFVQGYRLIDRYDKILLFSLMEYQLRSSTLDVEAETSRDPPPYKLVLWQMDNQDIFLGEKRRKYYEQMQKIGKWFKQIQYHIIYLHPGRYSIIGQDDLRNNSLPQCMLFYNKISWLQEKNGSRPIQEKQQGINLHALVELFIKGCGEARNPRRVKHLQGHDKYVYDLFKVVNTISYIVGRQMLENDYETITSQKWMRKATEKSFRRLDLVLRNREKCCVLDWKFTRLEAKDKIKGNWIARKNKTYYELASKDFKTSVELKFYCLHERVVTYNYHHFTCAAYNHNIEQVQIQESSEHPRIQGGDILLDSSIELIEGDEIEDFQDAEEVEFVSEPQSVIQLSDTPLSSKSKNKEDKVRRKQEQQRNQISDMRQEEEEQRQGVIDLCSDEEYIQVDSQPQ